MAAGCFITTNFPVGLGIDMIAARVRCAIGQRRILWLGWAGLGWAGLGWAGLGASSDPRGRCICVSHVSAIRELRRSMVGEDI